MIGDKVERIERLLKALDIADGKEDYVIHRIPALNYVKSELRLRAAKPDLPEDDITREELLMSLNSLVMGPPTFKRKNNYEILEALLSARKESGADTVSAAGG